MTILFALSMMLGCPTLTILILYLMASYNVRRLRVQRQREAAAEAATEFRAEESIPMPSPQPDISKIDVSKLAAPAEDPLARLVEESQRELADPGPEVVETAVQTLTVPASSLPPGSTGAKVYSQNGYHLADLVPTAPPRPRRRAKAKVAKKRARKK